jgi:hypothetical protein
VDFVHETAVRLVISPFSGWCRRQFGDAGAAVLEEVAADMGVRGVPGERWPIQRALQRYGPPPGSAPVARGPALPAERAAKPSTSALVHRMVSRPNVDSQAAQLAVAELQLAIRNAQVNSLFLYEYSSVYVLRYFVIYLWGNYSLHLICQRDWNFSSKYTVRKHTVVFRIF